MAYTATYDSADLAPITFDLVGTFMAAITGQAGVIAQLIVLSLIIALVTGVLAAILGIFNVGPFAGFFKRK